LLLAPTPTTATLAHHHNHAHRVIDQMVVELQAAASHGAVAEDHAAQPAVTVTPVTVTSTAAAAAGSAATTPVSLPPTQASAVATGGPHA
jgi:hypothetical protein